MIRAAVEQQLGKSRNAVESGAFEEEPNDLKHKCLLAFIPAELWVMNKPNWGFENKLTGCDFNH